MGVSRNRLIVNVLDRQVGRAQEWSPGFLERLLEMGPEDAAAVDEMARAITQRARS